MVILDCISVFGLILLRSKVCIFELVKWMRCWVKKKTNEIKILIHYIDNPNKANYIMIKMTLQWPSIPSTCCSQTQGYATCCSKGEVASSPGKSPSWLVSWLAAGLRKQLEAWFHLHASASPIAIVSNYSFLFHQIWKLQEVLLDSETAFCRNICLYDKLQLI